MPGEEGSLLLGPLSPVVVVHPKRFALKLVDDRELLVVLLLRVGSEPPLQRCLRASVLESPHRPKYKAKVRAASPAELAALLRHANNDERLLISVAACTGLRASELFGVRFEDIDFTGGDIHITRQLQDGWRRNAAEDREVTASSTFAYAFVRLLREDPRRFAGGLVFRSPEGATSSSATLIAAGETWRPCRASSATARRPQRSTRTPTLGLHAPNTAAKASRVLFGKSGSNSVADAPAVTAERAQVLELVARPERFELPTLRFEA